MLHHCHVAGCFSIKYSSCKPFFAHAPCPQALASDAMANIGTALGLPSSQVDPYIATHKSLSGECWNGLCKCVCMPACAGACALRARCAPHLLRVA